jgi:uncharacterized protein (DUF1697 family)
VVTVHVAFLRAVNVGKRRVRMARVVELAGQLGHRNVWTHVNSGNVVFEASGPRADLESGFESALEDEFGFEVTTFVRTATELRRTMALQPFAVGPGDTYFVTFLKDRPSADQTSALEALSNDFDTLVVDRGDVHWLMRGKSTETKLPTKAWDGVVGRHRSTSRNTTMLGGLMDKLAAKR